MIAKRRARIPKKEILEEISTGLSEIESYFEMEGFPVHAVELPEEQLPEKPQVMQGEGEDEDVIDYYDGGEASAGTYIFDREDVEVAIDVFISHLVQQKAIRTELDEVLSFEEVFERLFGKDHPISQKAMAFEEDIVGYFGRIYYDDMDAASTKLAEIQNMIRELRDKDAKGQ